MLTAFLAVVPLVVAAGYWQRMWGALDHFPLIVNASAKLVFLLSRKSLRSSGCGRTTVGKFPESTLVYCVFAVAGVAGAAVGVTCGLWTGKDTVNAWNNKNELRAECVAGNDRACRIYEVDYGR